MRFHELSKQRWTVFWQRLGINIPQRSSKVRTYKWSAIQARLRRSGVEESVSEQLNDVFSRFEAPSLQIIRFSQFFLQDRDLIQGLLSSATISAALDALIGTFEKDDHEQVYKTIGMVTVLRALKQKGHGESYRSELPGDLDPKEFDAKRLKSRLARHPKLNPIKFQVLAPAGLGGWQIFPFRKTIGRESWFIFLQLQRATDGHLMVRMTVDSEVERRLFLSEISAWYGSIVHGIEEIVDFRPLLHFVTRDGVSAHFILERVSFVDGDYVLSVENKFRRLRSNPMAPHRHMKAIKTPEQLSLLVVRHKSNELAGRPLIIPVSTPYNSRVLAALSFRLVDRNIRFHQAERIHADFHTDFKITLGAFARTGDVPEKSFCALFLQNDIRRMSRFGRVTLPLRMTRASDIWKHHQELTKWGILYPEKVTEHSSHYCFNRDCTQAFRPQKETRTSCDGCQSSLYEKPELSVGNISEEGVARWLARQAEDRGCDGVSVGRKVFLGRRLFLIEIIKGDSRQLYLPITTELKEQDREILSRRLPDVCVITSKGNTDDFEKNALAAANLHELYFDLRFAGKDRLLTYSRRVEQKAIKRIRDRAEDASEHLSTDDYYLQLNKAGKNIGAEAFEADCSTILRYMFGSARWLGATSRGHAVPDGSSAFPCYPSLGIANGFFVWDSKFTTAPHSRLGGVTKNRAYVLGMYKDRTARGAKSRGLLFISNRPEPRSFRQMARRIAGRRRMRVAYMGVAELLRIFQHFQKHEERIGNREKAKKLFFTMMMELLTCTSKKQGGKAVVITPDALERLIEVNSKALKRMKR